MTTDQKLIRTVGINRFGQLSDDHLRNMPVNGYSRDTFYPVKNAYEDGCLEALKEKSKHTTTPKEVLEVLGPKVSGRRLSFCQETLCFRAIRDFGT